MEKIEAGAAGFCDPSSGKALNSNDATTAQFAAGAVGLRGGDTKEQYVFFLAMTPAIQRVKR